MVRDRTARTRIRQYLATTGPVGDPSGYATGVLKDLIGYEGSSVAFIQLIAAMERDDEIVRDIRGKRTYEIAASPATVEAQVHLPAAPSASGVETVAGVQIDYDALARAIVRELFATAASATRALASAESAQAQRDDYSRRLDEARSNLDRLLADAEQMTSQFSA